MSNRNAYCHEHGITEQSAGSLYRNCGKRLFDLLVCVPILILASPLILLAAVLIKLDSKGPVFFNQERLGRYGSTFLTYKLRTMTDRVRTTHTEVLAGHSEVTRVGDWLRRFKIDELPQLLNIVKGDMSLVGPRPALPDHILKYNDDGLRRLLERPGMTGPAQVNGNIFLSWPERWQYDAQYVANLSALSDLGIALKTIGVVLLGERRFLNPIEAAVSEAAASDSPVIAMSPGDDEAQSTDAVEPRRAA